MNYDLDRCLARLRDREPQYARLGEVEQLAWQRIADVERRQQRSLVMPLQVAAVAIAFAWGIWGNQVTNPPQSPSSAFLVEDTEFLPLASSQMHVRF